MQNEKIKTKNEGKKNRKKIKNKLVNKIESIKSFWDEINIQQNNQYSSCHNTTY